MHDSSLYNQLKKYKFVSFDVFDTLILRTFYNPTDIWRITELIFKNKFNYEVKDFCLKRSYAESRARRIACHDVSIDEIYEQIDYPLDVSQALKNIEKECEIRNCIPNDLVIDTLNKCKSEGKIIIITSDMYLTKDVFDAIFEKIGVKYDYIYISGEIGVTKRSGDLFQYVLKDLNINGEELIHIGDDKHNDILMPKRHNIQSVERPLNHCKKNFYLTHDSRSIEKNHFYSFIEQASRNIENDESAFRIGFSILGPFIYSFCKWVHKIKEEKGIDKLFFLARDGYLLVNAYRLLYPEQIDEISYIALNKNLLRIPSLGGDRVLNKFILSLPPRRKYTWDYLLTYLQYDNKEEIITELTQTCADFNKDEIINYEDLVNGRYNEQLNYILDDCKLGIAEQITMLDDYLEDMGFFEGRVGLVNNSMEGTVQKQLLICANNRGKILDLHGLQFTASEQCKNTLKDSISIFWDKDDYKLSSALFRGNCLIFEHFLFEPCGTALNFYRDNLGSVCVNYASTFKEKKDADKLCGLQSLALSFVQGFNDHIPVNIEKISKEMMLSLFTRPCVDDALFIGELWDEDVEGTKQICNFALPNPRWSILFRHLGSEYGWDVGYFRVNRYSPIFNFFCKLRLKVVIYLKTPTYFFEDSLFFIKRLFDRGRITLVDCVNSVHLFLIRIRCHLNYYYEQL